jgi:hypothetical protein
LEKSQRIAANSGRSPSSREPIVNYIRRNPFSEKIDGKDLVDYFRKRFPKA